MKDSYHINGKLKCITCGDTQFEFNDDKSWVKCLRCGKEYLGAYNELLEINQDNIDKKMEEAKQEILKDIKEEINDMLRNAFKNNKNIRFKG